MKLNVTITRTSDGQADENTKKVYEEQDHIKNASEWRCSGCGLPANPLGKDAMHWRWDGKNWQHQHEYPVGHVICERKK